MQENKVFLKSSAQLTFSIRLYREYYNRNAQIFQYGKGNTCLIFKEILLQRWQG